jgi:hypothetical protein
MSIGSDGSQIEFSRKIYVGGTDAIFEFQEFLHDIVLPLARKTTTTSKLCELEVIEFITGEAEYLVEETLAGRLNEVEVVVLHAEIHLIDDFKKVNLKEGYREERAVDFQAERLVGVEVAGHVSAKRSPYAEELNIVRLDEAKRAEVVQLLIGEREGAKMVYLGVDFSDHFGCKFYVLIAALEDVSAV